MLIFGIALIASYLLGSIPAGYLAGWLAGVDIRKAGSGNIGATNVSRVLGTRQGYAVFAIDFLKGLAAVRLSILIAQMQLAGKYIELIGTIAAVACVLGHTFPIWLQFKGGKGVATSAGALFGLLPLAALVGALIWFIFFKFTRYVSVASIIAAIALPIVIFVMADRGKSHGGVLFWFSICLAALVVLRHRSNLVRLVRGTEPRFPKRK
jgi:acyl phosphate:glycerol-3-phosphate acyltransferase